MSSSFPLALKPPLPLFLQNHKRAHPLFPLFKTSHLPFSAPSKSHLCFSFPPSNHNLFGLDPDENFLLLLEEQRWLGEVQRWLRECDSLLSRIQSLKLQIQTLEAQILSQTHDNLPLQDTDVIKVSSEGKAKEKKKTLRKGCEGEEVREMQEALQRLGFYSGEEDFEYSSFSSGTERAVKTWQATLGTSEDGIMTAELLERLYTEQQIQSTRTSIGTDQKGSTETVPPEEGSNGAAVTSATEISEVQKKVVREEGIEEVEVSEHRVFLLGENRWEEPSRLVSRDKLDGGSKAKVTATKCLTCRGEGRLMCTECDGTGEPNIEPQFLEWVDEGTKCPYCEGIGYITCDVCEGKT